MCVAILREVSRQIGRCELTYQSRRPIDLALACKQHSQYRQTLAALGYTIRLLPEEPELPDSVFVEDTAVVLEELAIITRPGAGSRREETESVARVLEEYRRLARIQAPACLDGGDVLQIGKQLFVGLSRRSSPEAIRQIQALLGGHGYAVAGVPLRDCLHLKSAVTRVAADTILINRDWVDVRAFPEMERIDVDPSEPCAANALLVAGSVIFPAAFPATRRRLERRGLDVRAIDVSELAKAEGGVTCCSLIFPAAP